MNRREFGVRVGCCAAALAVAAERGRAQEEAQQDPSQAAVEEPQAAGQPQREQSQEGPEDRRHELAAPTLDGDSILSWERATGDWLGARSWLAERGVEAELLWTSDLSWVARGGVAPGATPFRSLFDLVLTAHTEELIGFEGGTLLVDFQAFLGDFGSSSVGDAQGFSNIDADDRAQLSKLWWEQRSQSGALTVRLGKMDANALFAWTEHGARFLNSSMGVSPTIVELPTYPETAFGAVVSGRPSKTVGALVGAFDGASARGVRTGSRGPSSLLSRPGDLFLVGQLDLYWSTETLPGRVGLGAWGHTAEFESFDGDTQDGTAGVYLVLDQLLWRSVDDRRLGGFLQLGLADPDVWPFAAHVGAGLEWVGAVPERPADAVGLGFTWADLSDAPGAGFTTEGELALELFWSFLATPWLRLKPDVQYIVDPGGDATIDDALVCSLRATVAF